MPHSIDADPWPLRPKSEEPRQPARLVSYRVELVKGSALQFDCETLHAERGGMLAFLRGGKVFAAVAAGQWAAWERISDA